MTDTPNESETPTFQSCIKKAETLLDLAWSQTGGDRLIKTEQYTEVADRYMALAELIKRHEPYRLPPKSNLGEFNAKANR